jgi:hypothetical protein
LGSAIRKQEELYYRTKGFPLDFNRAFWTPPLSAWSAYTLECRQIDQELKLTPLVSITDHDNIEAASMLQVMDDTRYHPVSVEWTIPFANTFFHLGVHNLPEQGAHAIMSSLAEYTAAPRRELLGELLESLNDCPDVLIVLNHPLWDESGVGGAEHNRLLGRLLERHGRHFHALELNGLRSWKENLQVIALAQETNLPVISGGDRHGCEPNATLNLTRASSFGEFVHEVRYDGFSEAVFMPQYREPLKLRVLRTMQDIVRDYDDQAEGRKHWNDRIFFRYPDGRVLPLSAIWHGRGPRVVNRFVSGLRLLEHPHLHLALRAALAEREEFGFER